MLATASGCGGSPPYFPQSPADQGTPTALDGGAGPFDAGPDLAGPDLAGPDPCLWANLGDGTYCGGNLVGSGADPDVLYVCRNKATASATPCKNGCQKAPSGVPDYCVPDEPLATPPGKGLWIWMFGQNAPDAATAALEAKQLGVGFVLVKSGEDDQVYAANFSAQNVAEFTSRGLEVFGWHYTRPGNLPAKIAAIAREATVPGVTGIVLDVESEFVMHGPDATTLCQGIRKAVPGVFLGYSTYGWVSYHPDFPYQAFDTDCGDAFLPQSYWDLWTTGPVGGYMKAVDGAAMLGLRAPIWAVQDDYNGATVADMNAFFQAAGPRSSLWRWPDPSRTDLLALLPQLQWTN